MRSKPTPRGSGCGSGMGSVAEPSPQSFNWGKERDRPPNQQECPPTCESGDCAHWTVPSSSRMLRFFPITRTSFPRRPAYFDRHAEERVFILLVVRSKGVLVEQHQFGVVRARFRRFGKLRADGSDQAGLSLHAFVIGHLAMRIADSAPRRLLRVRSTPRRLVICSATTYYLPSRFRHLPQSIGGHDAARCGADQC
jgi:hypothetical protein